MSEPRRDRTFARYLAFQLPGWVIALVVLRLLNGWLVAKLSGAAAPASVGGAADHGAIDPR